MPAGAYCFSNTDCRAFVEKEFKNHGGKGDVGEWCTKSKQCRDHLIKAYKASPVDPKKDGHHAEMQNAIAYCFSNTDCRDFIEGNFKHDGGKGDVGAWCVKEKDCAKHVLGVYKKSLKA